MVEVAAGVSDERRGGKGKEGKGGKEDEWIGGVNNFRRRANRFVFFFSLFSPALVSRLCPRVPFNYARLPLVS